MHRHTLRAQPVAVLHILAVDTFPVVPGLPHRNHAGHDAHPGIRALQPCPGLGLFAVPGLDKGDIHGCRRVVGIHVVGGVRRAGPVDIVRGRGVVLLVVVGTLRVPCAVIAVVHRRSHIQVDGELLPRVQDIGCCDVRLVIALGVHRNGGHFSLQCVRHSPDTVFQASGHFGPDIRVGQSVGAAPGAAVEVDPSPHVCVDVVVKHQSGRCAVVQLRPAAVLDQFGQVHGLQRSLPLALAVPGAAPGLFPVHVVLIVPFVRQVRLEGVVDQDARGLRVLLGGNGQPVGVFAALGHGNLVLVPGATAPGAVQIRPGVLPEFHLLREVSVPYALRDAQVHEPFLIAVRVQVTHPSANLRVGNAVEVGVGGTRPYVRTSDGLVIILIRQVPQPARVARFKRRVVDRVPVPDFVVVRPRHIHVHGDLDFVPPAVVSLRIIAGQFFGVRRQRRLHRHQGPSAVSEVFRHLHVGNPVAAPQLDCRSIRYEVFRKKQVPGPGGLRDDGARRHRFVVFGSVRHVGLLVHCRKERHHDAAVHRIVRSSGVRVIPGRRHGSVDLIAGLRQRGQAAVAALGCVVVVGLQPRGLLRQHLVLPLRAPVEGRHLPSFVLQHDVRVVLQALFRQLQHMLGRKDRHLRPHRQLAGSLICHNHRPVTGHVRIRREGNLLRPAA